MARKEITDLVRTNLYKVSVGDRFATETALYKRLGIKIDQNGNKAQKKAVKLFIHWELSGKLNKKKKVSKEIIVTDIIENPEVIDRRINNGGARNLKYLPLIRPVLLSYKYRSFITYKAIFEELYCFSTEEFRATSSDRKHVKQYKNELYNKLKEITNSALRSLQRDGLLTYQKIYVSYGASDILCDYSFNFTDQMSLQELSHHIIDGVQIFELLEKDLNKCVDTINRERRIKATEDHEPNLEEYFSFENMTIQAFVKRLLKAKRYRDTLQVFDSKKDPKSAVIVDSEKTALLDQITNAACHSLGYASQEVVLNSGKRMRVYAYTNIIHKLLGFGNVYTALHIDVHNRDQIMQNESIEDFSHKKLLATLEPYMINYVLKQAYNPAKAREQKVAQGKVFVFKQPKVSATPDIDFYYLAADNEVKNLHCRIFGHNINEFNFPIPTTDDDKL